jgi:simple sugar transport system permease protein
MLNFIALGLISYIIIRTNVGRAASFNVRGTEIIPPNGRMVGWNLLSPTIKVYGFIIVAALIGVLYWFVLNRTVFGYDLRASGLSVSAASASGVNSKRMVVIAMLISGGIAGMVGLPDLLGNDPYSYTLNFPSGYGFTGIAIALLGRNNPIGIAFGAILWAFLDVSSQILDIENVPREIVTIMQGVIVLAVVVAYELVRRNRVKSEQQNVGEALTQKESSAS